MVLPSVCQRKRRPPYWPEPPAVEDPQNVVAELSAVAMSANDAYVVVPAAALK